VIIAILIGAALLGVLGALIAIPAAAAVQAVVRDYWHFRQGGDSSPPSTEARAEAG
jgi:predicted PurR-regulated permease PerM